MVPGKPVEKALNVRLGLIGESAPMRALIDALPKIAATDAPLLVGGESGTGKDLIARAAFSLSARASGPFVVVNCAALPENLMQSELFGHETSTFTGAERRKTGKLEAAHGGTILLEEIGDLSMDVQANLLQVLETRTFDIGGGDTVKLDVRIIATTGIDLEDAVRRNRFREDLYYHLNVLSVFVPPLRERGQDVQLLADYFLSRYTSQSSAKRVVAFSPDARFAMQSWHWPGNVRELVNRIRKAIVMCERGPLTRRDLGLERRSAPRDLMTIEEARDAAEVRAILNALDASGGRISAAAEVLGVSRMTLYRLMKKHDFESESREIDASKTIEL